MNKNEPRSLKEIGDEIQAVWKDIDHDCIEYLIALKYLRDIDDEYFGKKGRDIVEKLINGMMSYETETGYRIRNELRAILRS